jgi:hypothetical protein
MCGREGAWSGRAWVTCYRYQCCTAPVKSRRDADGFETVSEKRCEDRGGSRIRDKDKTLAHGGVRDSFHCTVRSCLCLFISFFPFGLYLQTAVLVLSLHIPVAACFSLCAMRLQLLSRSTTDTVRVRSWSPLAHLFFRTARDPDENPLLNVIDFARFARGELTKWLRNKPDPPV